MFHIIINVSMSHQSIIFVSILVQPCMSIPHIENGQHNGSSGNFSNGEVVRFTCNDKYRLIGANTVTCGDFGVWSASPPTCDRIQGKPKDI